jgi:hypothetical protein
MAEERIPDFFVEQVALGEASPLRRSRVERALGREELDRRLEELRRSDAEILVRYPAAHMAERIRAEARATSPDRGLTVVRKPSRRRALLLSVPLAAAAAVGLALALLPRVLDGNTGQSLSLPEATRVKGEPNVLIYREGPKGAELLTDGQLARRGDRIQIKYVPAGWEYGAIVSIDGRGTVTLHYPAQAAGSTRLEGENEVLDYAYVLDDAPSFERFFFVAAPKEFAAALAVGSAERLAGKGAQRGSLDLPAGFVQTSVLLTKGE